MELFQIIIWLTVLFGIPAAIITIFIIALVKFCKTPKDSPERSTKKVVMIISATLLGLLIAGIVFLAISFTLAMNHM